MKTLQEFKEFISRGNAGYGCRGNHWFSFTAIEFWLNLINPLIGILGQD